MVDTDTVTGGRMLCLYSLFRQMLFEAQKVRTSSVAKNRCKSRYSVVCRL